MTKLNNYVNKILQNVKDIHDIEQINEYIANLNISNNSKRMIVYHWKKYCDQNQIDYKNIKKYEQEFKTVKNDLSYEEVQQIKQNLTNPKIKFYFNSLLETGMRISEFLDVDWFNLETREIGIKTSKNKNEYRFVFISEETFETIQELKEQEFDFSNVNEDNIQYELRKLGKVSHIDISLSPHVLRRTKGSLLRLNGAKIEDIADVLGHKSMETTRKFYSKLNRQHLKSISELSELKPSDAIALQELKNENELLKKQIVLLKQELEYERNKNNEKIETKNY